MNEKIETGVMAVKNGKGWGNLYSDGHSSSDGWVDMVDAEISDPEFCTEPTDLTYENSPDTNELKTAKLVMVRKITKIEVVNDEKF